MRALYVALLTGWYSDKNKVKMWSKVFVTVGHLLEMPSSCQHTTRAVPALLLCTLKLLEG